MIGISAILTGLVAWLTKNSYTDFTQDLKVAGELVPESSPSMTLYSTAAPSAISSLPPWAWFGIGALIVIVLILIINWKKL
jgi:hypothetical protein